MCQCLGREQEHRRAAQDVSQQLSCFAVGWYQEEILRRSKELALELSRPGKPFERGAEISVSHVESGSIFFQARLCPAFPPASVPAAARCCRRCPGPVPRSLTTPQPSSATRDDAFASSCCRQCVYLRMKDNPSLSAAFAATCDKLGEDKASRRFMPHMSLIYSDISEDERKAIVSEARWIPAPPRNLTCAFRPCSRFAGGVAPL